MIKILGERGPTAGTVWIDVSEPTESELLDLAEEYGLHSTSLKDCLDPEHLPKFESVGDTNFLILRHADHGVLGEGRADTVTELTRKLAIFVLPNGLITVHRAPQQFISDIFTKWQAREFGPAQIPHLLNTLIKAVFITYEVPLQKAELEFATLESKVFLRQNLNSMVEKLYFMKRRASVFKKMLRSSLDAVARCNVFDFRATPYYQDVREEGERQYFHADEMSEDANSLMQTQLSLASHRTNEVMRVLTLFSAFFLPLTFIVGVYGMNFRYLPELEWHYGYPAVLAAMAAITVAIAAWFKNKKWL